MLQDTNSQETEMRSSQMRNTEWIVTTRSEAWRTHEPTAAGVLSGMPDVMVDLDAQLQRIEGFGPAFNEMGWTSLGALTDEQRREILHEMFAPGVGANFTVGRMPMGANDFSRDWYSYDEVPGDFELEHFSIENDHETLIPFIRAAREQQPGLALWASPWSPPTWMKTNGHYAAALPVKVMGQSENGLEPHQVGREGTDMFILEEPYLRAYANYFGKFIDAYAELGIDIGMVMPQNEFNSAQVFPSCTWTPDGLAAFLRHLGPVMGQRGVEIFFGTLERGNPDLLNAVLADPEAAAVVTGVGAQWHGKGAVRVIHREHPELRIYQTEQECGDGRNDWRYARYSWALMRDFFLDGAEAYLYWNLSLERGGVSRWGWSQNSLVVVDPETATFEYTHEYHVLKHVSHFVEHGARLVQAKSFTGFENQLAFRNPDGSVAIVIQNDLSEEQPVTLLLGDKVFTPVLPADSLSTFVFEV